MNIFNTDLAVACFLDIKSKKGRLLYMTKQYANFIPVAMRALFNELIVLDIQKEVLRTTLMYTHCTLHYSYKSGV